MTAVRAAAPVLIIVQNLPVPFDRRVWLECQALRGAGYDVTVVCPQGEGDPAVPGHRRRARSTRTRPYAPGGSALGFVARVRLLVPRHRRLALRARRGGPFDVVQACNPPDIFWPLARLLRLRDGSRFVFDHHDLCPELYESRFPAASRAAAPRAARSSSGRPSATADRVISTNESYAEVAIAPRAASARATSPSCAPGPDPDELRRGEPVPALRRGRRTWSAYLGVMGPQDGVDLVLRAAARRSCTSWAATDIVVHAHGRRRLLRRPGRRCATELGLQDYVELPGRVPDETVRDVLSTADVGLCPDPKNPLNDVSTMNKTMEYMAFGLPGRRLRPRETRVSADDAAVYAEPNDVADVRRRRSSTCSTTTTGGPRWAPRSRARSSSELAWAHQQEAYVGGLRRPDRPAERRARRIGGLTVCGIAGAYQQADGKVAGHGPMIERIAHRGPDAGGVTRARRPERRGRSWRHRRLSIIDLSRAADQPMVKRRAAR